MLGWCDVRLLVGTLGGDGEAAEGENGGVMMAKGGMLPPLAAWEGRVYVNY